MVRRPSLATILAIGLAICAGGWFSAHRELSSLKASLATSCTILRAIDGDTVELEDLGRVRILGIDAPELFQKHEEPDGAGGIRVRWERLAQPQPGAVEAYEYLRSLEGSKVRVQWDQERCDKYGRPLVHLYLLPAGPDLASELLRRGWAQPLIIPPNTSRAQDWRAAAGSMTAKR
ncbi:MAG: thermonuclease family protein [Planctomycetota bacterium]|nr:thermonuclease family protein [Planctomycetota bacterium]